MAGSQTLTRVKEATDQLSFDVGDAREPVSINGDQWPVALLLAFDLLAAAVALPLALLLLGVSSSAESNSIGRFWTNVGNDASFPWPSSSPWPWPGSTGRVAGHGTKAASPS